MEDLKKFSLFLYVISLIVPTFFGDGTAGIWALLMGWMGVFSLEPVFALPWLANFTFFSSLLITKKRAKLRFILSIITILFASVAVFIKSLPSIDSKEPQVTVGVGFFFWMVSFILMLIYNYKSHKSEVEVN